MNTMIRGARVGAMTGLALGVVYSVGGFFVDLFTIGLNRGTVLAFGALVGMPILGGLGGFVVGSLLEAVNRVRRRADG